jgi:hypothetical protein
MSILSPVGHGQCAVCREYRPTKILIKPGAGIVQGMVQPRGGRYVCYLCTRAAVAAYAQHYGAEAKRR